jgi:chromate transport protein ChrA
MRHLLKYGGVKAFLGGVRPAVVGMILATAITMLLGQTLGISGESLTFAPDFAAIGIFAICTLAHLVYSHFKEKALSPILLIVASGVLGVLFYGI